MPTLVEINLQIKNLGSFEGFLGRREINELPNILWAEEGIENIIQGTYNNGNGILVATHHRLIFVDKGFLYGLKVEDFPYDKISSIQYETGILMGKLTIFTSGNKAVIENVLKSKVRVFGDSVRAKIAAPKTMATSPHIIQVQATASPQQEPMNIVEQLERLAKLKAQGILTEEEFAGQKKKLLGL